MEYIAVGSNSGPGFLEVDRRAAVRGAPGILERAFAALRASVAPPAPAPQTVRAGGSSTFGIPTWALLAGAAVVGIMLLKR